MSMDNGTAGFLMIYIVNALCWIVGWLALRSDTPATK